MRDMQQRYFTSVFPMIAAQPDFLRHFFIPENIATSFPPALSWRYESLLVSAINIALLRSATLRAVPLSYGNECSFLLLLQFYRSVPLRAAKKSLLEFQL
jgi:hypothetical protein